MSNAPSADMQYRPARRRREPFALYAMPSMTVTTASGVPTPLYRPYRESRGFSQSTPTIVFGVCALGLPRAFGRLHTTIGSAISTIVLSLAAAFRTVSLLQFQAIR